MMDARRLLDTISHRLIELMMCLFEKFIEWNAKQVVITSQQRNNREIDH